MTGKRSCGRRGVHLHDYVANRAATVVVVIVVRDRRVGMVVGTMHSVAATTVSLTLLSFHVTGTVAGSALPACAEVLRTAVVRAGVRWCRATCGGLIPKFDRRVGRRIEPVPSAANPTIPMVTAAIDPMTALTGGGRRRSARWYRIGCPSMRRPAAWRSVSAQGVFGSSFMELAEGAVDGRLHGADRHGRVSAISASVSCRSARTTTIETVETTDHATTWLTAGRSFGRRNRMAPLSIRRRRCVGTR